MTEKDVLKLFDKEKALLTGHFKLSSGLHSEKYLQCALVLQHPKIAEKLARELAGRFKDERPEVVIGPALGGVTWAYEVARAFGIRGIFTERLDNVMTLRRGFAIGKNERVLVVEDVVTTGGSTKEVIETVKRAGGIVVGVGAVIDRSGGAASFGVKFEALARLVVETYPETACPLCKKGGVAVKPGSRK